MLPLVTFVGIVLSACLIVTAVLPGPSAGLVGAAAPATAREVGAQTPTLTPDGRLCLAVSSVIEDSAMDVKRFRQDGQRERITRLRAAEGRLGHYAEMAGPGLRGAVRGMRDAIGDLRRALESGSDIRAPTDVVLSEIDAVDAACRPQPYSGRLTERG